MKNCCKLVCFLLALVMLVACTNGGGTVEDPTTPPASRPVEDEGILIVRRGIPQYSIVCASGLTEEQLALVTRVQETIQEYTDAIVPVKTDSDERDENAKEILIGATGYEASKTAKKALSKNGYAIVAVDNKIAAVADNNYALEELLYYMIDVLIPQNVVVVQGKLTLKHVDYEGTYVEPEVVQFNGVPITEFSVVYSTEVPEMEQIASDLATRIGTAFKTTIDCYSEEKPERQHEILVGLTDRWLSAEVFADAQVPLMSYRIVVQEETVQFACPGAHSGNEMIAAFYQSYIMSTSYRNLRNGVHMEKNLLTVTSQPLTAGSTLRIMTSNIWGDYFGNEVQVREDQLFEVYMSIQKFSMS